MKTGKASILLAVIALFLIVAPALSPAQTASLPQRLSLVEISSDVTGNMEHLEVFNMPQEGVNQYFLSVGHLGIGDEVVQILFDPLFELFIPLGGTVSEALETLKEMQSLFKDEPNTFIELPGCLALAFPNGDRETVKITYRKVLLSNMLEFSLRREGYIRSTHIQRSDFNSLVNGTKLYGKIHLKE